MSVMEWIAAIAAAAFIALVIGALVGLRAAAAKAAALQSAMENMQREVQQLAQEYARLVKPAEQTILLAQKQLQSANGLFEAAAQMGGAIEHSVSAVHRVSSILSSEAKQHAERAAANKHIGEAYEWMELGMTAWQLWQTRRKNAEKSSEWRNPDKGHHKSERSE